MIDLLLILCFFLIDLGRISLAKSGNKTGNFAQNRLKTGNLAIRGPVGVSVALTVAAVFCSIYIYQLQTFVLQIEQTMMCKFLVLFFFGKLIQNSDIYWGLVGLALIMKFVALSSFH